MSLFRRSCDQPVPRTAHSTVCANIASVTGASAVVSDARERAPRRAGGGECSGGTHDIAPPHRPVRHALGAPDPTVGDRGGPGDAGPVRTPSGHLRRLHGVGAGTDVHRGLHPRRGPPAICQHPHRIQRNRAADHATARGRPRRDPRRRRRRRPDGGDLRRRRLYRGDRQTDRGARPADSGRAGRRVPPHRRHPPRAASGGLHRSVRTPLQRVALAGVDCRRGGDRPGHRRTHRCRRAASASSSGTPTDP